MTPITLDQALDKLEKLKTQVDGDKNEIHDLRMCLEETEEELERIEALVVTHAELEEEVLALEHELAEARSVNNALMARNEELEKQFKSVRANPEQN